MLITFLISLFPGKEVTDSIQSVRTDLTAYKTNQDENLDARIKDCVQVLYNVHQSLKFLIVLNETILQEKLGLLY